MKILEIHNRYLSRAGEDAAVDQIYKTLSHQHNVYRYLRESREWIQPNAPSPWKQALSLFHHSHALREIQEVHHHYQPDYWLIHNPLPVISLGVYELAHRLNIKVIQYLHNYRPFSVSGTSYAVGKPLPLKSNLTEISEGTWQNSSLKTALLSGALWNLRRSPAYQTIYRWIAISDFQREKMIEAGLPSDRVYRLYHSWDMETPATPPSDLGYYLFLGRLTEEKGVRTLLQAWEILQKKGDHSKLIICGEGPLEQEVRKATGLNSQIEFQGIVSGNKKEKLLSECRALIAPSLWWEPLGLIVYEAYENQKPVFAARSGGLQEIVLHEKTGYLHQPGNSSELAQQILNNNKTSLQSTFIGRQGKEWLMKNAHFLTWIKEFNKIIT